MKSSLIRAASVAVGVGLTCLALKPAQEQTTTSQIVSAANAFLSTLDDKQRQAVLFSFDDQEQRKRWSNFPVAVVPRGGINLKDMNSAQRSAAMALVASALSPRGFEKVQQIMEGDEVNKTTDQGPGGNRGPRRPSSNGGPPPGNGGPPPSGGGGNRPAWNGPIFGKDLYWYISILGTLLRNHSLDVAV